MSAYVFQSHLAQYIEGLVREKRAAGYKYSSQGKILEMFDRFLIDNGFDDGSLTREMVMSWATQRPTECKNYRNNRVSAVRQLAWYMVSLDKAAYVPKHFASSVTPAPHIFSDDELSEFFGVVDGYCPPQFGYQHSAPANSILFRLFYCCGLRLSEGCQLKTTDVDLHNGVLSIRQSKGRKDRLVYMSDGMAHMCRQYDRLMQRIIPEREWFFPGRDMGKPVSKSGIDGRFTLFWNMTSFAGSVGKKPTVHCFRHSYVVSKMNEWMGEGIDFASMMPYLSRYLGHASISETQYYYHMAVSAFGVIRSRDKLSAKVIPEVTHYEEEQ